jgi:SAM-dependent methyltransferase
MASGRVEQWRRMVEARHEQGRRLDREHRRGDAWGAGRAARFRRNVAESGTADPLIERVARLVDGEATVLDVGAGTGRHALALARLARRVVAVEPSAAMREQLAANVAEAGVTNLEVVAGEWPAAAERVEAADVVICAHVLYPVVEVEPFLRALDAKARRACFAQLRIGQREGPYLELFERVWGEPRHLAPTAVDLFDVAHELGFAANFEVVPFPAWRRFDSVDEAVENARQDILNPEGKDELIRAFVEPRLEPVEGKLALPNETRQAGVVWWRT